MKQYLTEEMRRLSDLLSESKIQESTLSKLIGNDPGGQDMVRWLHSHDKLSNTADFGEITKGADGTGRVYWQQFKRHPDQFLIVSGANAIVAIKPEDSDPEIDRSRDGTLMYNVVGFQKGERIDNLLVPLPDPESKEFKVGKGKNAEDNKEKYQAAVKAVKAQHNKTINKDAPPTKIASTRGGLPFGNDRRGAHNIFGRIREVLGGIQGIYSSTSHVGDMDKKDVKGYVKDYEPGKVPKGDISGEFGEPNTGKRKGGGIERDKINKRGATSNISLSSELIKVGERMRPVFRSVGRPIIRKLQKSASAAKMRGNNAKYAELKDAENFIKQVIATAEEDDKKAEFGSLSHPGGKVLASALLKASGETDAESDEFKEWLEYINSQPATKLKSVVDVLRAELMTYAKEG